jgi:uncharacterized Ntn-hydrolase superfamily protein
MRLQHLGMVIHEYVWGNNARRAELKGRRCVVEARGRMGTVLVRFLDTGERVTTSRRALRRIEPVRSHVKSTFSIVATDPEAREVGCAVQSRYFAVGTVVPWVRAGVGAVATQAAGVAAYGLRALAELEAGASPGDALARVLAGDDGRETRQLGLVTAAGDSAAHTGAECLAWAGHRTGRGYAVQGNILASEDVVVAMESAFLDSAVMPLGHRLVAALEAGQEQGGDARGQQSAAVVVERAGAAQERREGIDRTLDLRVDDHAEPIRELRRLYEIHRRWDALSRATFHHRPGSYELGATILREALDDLGEDPVVLYDLACFEALAGQTTQAAAHLGRALELDPSLRASAEGDPDLDALRA